MFNNYFGITKQTEHLDIPLNGDIEVFICPYKVANSRHNDIAQRIYKRTNIFMQKLNKLVKQGDKAKAKELLYHLHESNEYHLGYSSKNKGSAVGNDKAKFIYTALSNNKFVKSGITITDEAHNVLLLVDGIGPDIMSDIISNICKDIFSEFTIKQCEKYKVSLPEKYIIEYFDDISGSWQMKEFNLPCYEGKKIILVPEFLVSKKRQYYIHYNRFITSNHVTKDILNNKKNIINRDKYIRKNKKKQETPLKNKIFKDFRKNKRDTIDFVREYGDKTLIEFQDHLKEIL